MIEKIAKAMCEANGTIWGGPRGEDDPDFLLVKLSYMGMARAAIEAMREPTENMVWAGAAHMNVAKDATSLRLVSGAFTAMIGQALVESRIPSPPVTEETK